MNLILFEEEELGRLLDFSDSRALHMRNILRLKEGDVFSAGILGGRIGRGRLLGARADGWEWTFTDESDSPPLRPLTLVLGCPRPPVARRVLRDMSTLGLRELRACTTDLNEKSYLGAKLWREGRWREALVEGASQGVSTRIPAVRTAPALERALEDLPADAVRIAMDNARDAGHWETWKGRPSGAVLAIGPERGWSDRERRVLDALGFIRLRLGNRVLRTETACSLGAGLLLDRMGALD